MYKRIFLSFLASLFFTFSFAQQKTFTLKELLDLSVKNHPATKQKDYIKALGEENEKLLKASSFPELNVTEQNTFQSEVTKLDIPGFSGPKKDNYNIGLDVRYPLTPFRMLHIQKETEQAKTDLGLSQLDIGLQKLRDRIIDLYGNILLQKESKDVLLVRSSDLEAQRKKVAVGVANGVVLKSNQLVFESELLITDQKIADIDAALQGLTQQLSVMTGTKIAPSDNFQLPADDMSNQLAARPETKAFKAQSQLLDLEADMLKKENHPKVFVYGQGFYGRPGYNFLDNTFRTYGMVGLGVSLNINNLLTQSSHLKTIGLNKQILSQKEEEFNMNLQVSLDPKKAEIGKYENIISKDEQILNNRKEIIRAANSQLENGVITSTDYLTELNAENNAQLNLTLHKVQLALAIAEYNSILGL